MGNSNMLLGLLGNEWAWENITSQEEATIRVINSPSWIRLHLEPVLALEHTATLHKPISFTTSAATKAPSSFPFSHGERQRHLKMAIHQQPCPLPSSLLPFPSTPARSGGLASLWADLGPPGLDPAATFPPKAFRAEAAIVAPGRREPPSHPSSLAVGTAWWFYNKHTDPISASKSHEPTPNQSSSSTNHTKPKQTIIVFQHVLNQTSMETMASTLWNLFSKPRNTKNDLCYFPWFVGVIACFIFWFS